MQRFLVCGLSRTSLAFRTRPAEAAKPALFSRCGLSLEFNLDQSSPHAYRAPKFAASFSTSLFRRTPRGALLVAVPAMIRRCSLPTRMNQLQDVFLGLEKRDYARATTSQKCVRAGGKQTSLENVAHQIVTTRFLRCWKFFVCDYFKKDRCVRLGADYFPSGLD